MTFDPNLNHVLIGSDATEAFEDVGHSPDARDMQQKYLIGVVSSSPSSKNDGNKPKTTGDSR